MLVHKCLVVFLSAIVFAVTVFAGEVSSCKEFVGKSDLPFVVVGRVVDSNGRPIKGSSVSLDPRGSTEFLNPYESATTDGNGCFKFNGFGDRKSRKAKWFLYTTDNFNEPGIALISPPFVSRLRRLDSRYNGIPFIPGDRDVIDFGDVPIVFRYGSARLRFDNCPENKCSSVIQWGTAEISLVHCRSNKWVERSTLSRGQLRQYIYDEKTDLIYLLPKGNWKLEIYNSNSKTPAASSACFDIEIKKVVDIPVQLSEVVQNTNHNR